MRSQARWVGGSKIEIATLTARLEADIGNLVRNAATADATLAGLRTDIAKTEASFKDMKKSIDVTVPTHQVASAVASMDTIRRSAGSLRDTYIETGAAAGRLGPSDAKAVSAVAKIEAMTAATKRLRDAEVEAAVVSSGTGGGGGGLISRLLASGAAGDAGRRGGNNGFAAGGFLAGILPGGRRAGAGAVTTAVGLGLAAGPAVLPSVLAAAPLLGAGLTTLIGAAGTLKLAFADLTSAAFTTQKGFNALTPVQQNFVSTLRSLDAGLLKGNLEPLAQRTLLPQLTSALHAAFTPAAVRSLQTGVSGFSNAIGGGAQQLGHLFGSSGFQNQFGTLLKQDAGYLRQFLSSLTHLIDAFVRFQVAAGPFLTWLGDAWVGLTKWIDAAVRADAANGRLAQFFAIIKESLQVVGSLFASVGHLAAAFVDAIGFQNSAAVVRLLTEAINGLAKFLERNQTVFRAFFSGAVQAAHDLLTVVGGISRALSPLLRLIDRIVSSMGGWRAIIDALVALKLADMFLRWSVGIRLVGAASAAAAGEVSVLRLALMSLGGPAVLAAIGGLAAVLGPVAVLIAALTITPSAAADAQGTYAPVGTPNELLYQAGKAGKTGTISLGGGGSINLAHLTGDSARAYAAGQRARTPGPLGGLFGYLPASAQEAIQKVQNAVSSIPGTSAFGTPPPLQGTGAAGQTALANLRANLATHATAIQTARTALSSGAASTSTPGQQLAAVNIALHFASLQSQALDALKKRLAAEKQTAALKTEENRVQSEINSTARLIATAQRDQLRALKAIAESQAARRVFAILGIGSGAGPGVPSVLRHESSVLAAEMKRVGLVVRPNESISSMVATLKAHGDLPKSAVESLWKIHEALVKLPGLNARDRATAIQNITSRLDQINQTLLGKNAYPTVYRHASVAQLMKGLPGTPAERMAFAQQLEALQGEHGKIPSGPTAFGLPVSAGGNHFHGPITISIDAGDHPDPKVLAAKIHQELSKSARRNPTQTRGPNAGRNRNLN